MTRFIFFFFSSRRRHTRCSRDWSSDVCSSDLVRSDTDLGPEAVPHAARLATDARQAGLPPQRYLRGVADLRAALTHALGPMYRVEREVRPVGDCRLFVAREVPTGPELLVKLLPAR